MNQNRVVVTGLGAISALGSSVDLLWEGLLQGRSGIRRITQFDPIEMPCKIAGEVPDFDPTLYMERKEIRRTPRAGQIALAAAIQAIADAGLPQTMPDPERTGVVFGTAMSAVDKIEEGLTALHTIGLDKVSPFSLPFTIPNLSAFLIAKQFQCLGPNNTVTTACAAGTQAVGEGSRLIRQGFADTIITGGTESQIRDFAIGGFAVMRALPVNYNDNPEAASRPFDAKREGFIFSEGAASLVLESLEHAQARGARIYAEILGYASSSDGYNIVIPDPSAMGAMRAMRWAIEDAKILPQEVDYINAHGTSTPLGDATETKAIKMVFGEHAYNLAISSTKSMLGHSMGGSGAIEALATTKIIHTQTIHPTINYEFPDPECDLDYTPNVARQRQVNVALSNSFGLGGQNAVLVFKRFQ